MKSSVFRFFVSLVFSLSAFVVFAQSPAGETQADLGTATRASAALVDASRIRFIHMGGNDCPPCVVWRALEYPKLKNSPIFRGVQFSYVVKSIRSGIPSAFFLDADVKPLKAKLDVASGGTSGSPHQVLLVDGEVYDYWFGTRDAKDLELKIAALTGGTRYPGARCTRLYTNRSCAETH